MVPGGKGEKQGVLIGVVEEPGPGCARLRVGDRVGALTVWGADAERECMPEAGAVEVPEDLDPAEVLNLTRSVQGKTWNLIEFERAARSRHAERATRYIYRKASVSAAVARPSQGS